MSYFTMFWKFISHERNTYNNSYGAIRKSCHQEGGGGYQKLVIKSGIGGMCIIFVCF